MRSVRPLLWIAAAAVATLSASLAVPVLRQVFGFEWPGAGPLALLLLLLLLLVAASTAGLDALKGAAWVRRTLGGQPA